MAELFEKFGIDPILLVAQIINFVILIFLLSKFLYRPIIKILEKREGMIKEGLAEAERIKKKGLEVDQLTEQKIKQALVGAQKIIQQAKEEAGKSKQEILEKTSQEIETMKIKMAREISARQKEVVDKIKQQAGEMITLTLSRVIANLDPRVHHQIIKKAIQEIKKLSNDNAN